MQRNKKKSKALIITFIVMLCLLFVFYLLFLRNNTPEIKSTSSENKGFLSLFSKNKDKDLDVIDGDNTGSGDTNTSNDLNTGDIIDGVVVGGDDSDENNQGNDGQDNNGPASPGDLDIPRYNPRLSPIPTPQNPDIVSTNPPVVTTNPPPTPDTDSVKQCNLDDYKLKFTAEEQAELDRLLRDFYRIASSVKTQEDVDLEYEAKESYIGLVDEAKELTTQCYTQTSDAKYLTGYDWANSESEKEFTPGGNLMSTNYSRPNEARLERKPNPWFSPSVGSGYFYSADIIVRSERYSQYSNEARVSEQPYDSRVFTNNLTARNACVIGANNMANTYRTKTPLGYSVSAKCFVLDGLVSDNSKAGKKIYVAKGSLWYPTVNWNNDTSSDIDPKEWYQTESVCKQRSPICVRPFFGTFEKDTRVPPIEWAYSISIRSNIYFDSMTSCQNATKSFGYANAKCTNSSGENAYITKLWSQITQDGTEKVDGYVAPIDYPIFENLFNIW